MFTGIIEEVGQILASGTGVLRVRASRILEGTKLGDSVAIDGVDLTVFDMSDAQMSFNVMPESYRRSTLGRLRAGHRVNLERSLRAGDRLSGHIVRGVVEGTGKLKARRDEGDAIVVTYSTSSSLLEHIIEKGPVCVDGVSLTVVGKTEKDFSVSLVEFTQRSTNLLDNEMGDLVNLETDILMRYVVHALETRRALTARIRGRSTPD
jgi:riboflavin synthase